jgi:hypothetical protein
MSDTENQLRKKGAAAEKPEALPWCGWKPGSSRDLRKDGSIAGQVLLLQNCATRFVRRRGARVILFASGKTLRVKPEDEWVVF